MAVLAAFSFSSELVLLDSFGEVSLSLLSCMSVLFSFWSLGIAVPSLLRATFYLSLTN
jgi:hypothetical protein